jgi:excisionase family DNA binding protein
MAKTDHSHWLTKQQAAEAIGCSTKTVEQLAKAKQIQQGFHKRPETGATVSMYHPEDVNRIRLGRNPEAEPFAVPNESPVSSKGASTALTAARNTDHLLGALATALSGTSQNGPVRIAEKQFLTLSEAAHYSGLPLSHIRRLMKEEKLEALKTGSGWRIRRADLQKL